MSYMYSIPKIQTSTPPLRQTHVEVRNKENFNFIIVTRFFKEKPRGQTSLHQSADKPIGLSITY